jgi:O-acetylhomoserine/O-acetylserine sulfhydrylase-like pyridoxal-dependent enzyme
MEEKIGPKGMHTRAVHTGDRKPLQGWIPVTTPIYTASSFIYPDIDQLDKVFGREAEGPVYARYSNPTNDALEELTTSLESGAGALACSSGMAALQVALATALTDRRKCVVASESLYGASISLLMKVLDPMGVQIKFVDFCNLDANRGQARGAADGNHHQSHPARGRSGPHWATGEIRRRGTDRR